MNYKKLSKITRGLPNSVKTKIIEKFNNTEPLGDFSLKVKAIGNLKSFTEEVKDLIKFLCYKGDKYKEESDLNHGYGPQVSVTEKEMII